MNDIIVISISVIAGYIVGYIKAHWDNYKYNYSMFKDDAKPSEQGKPQWTK